MKICLNSCLIIICIFAKILIPGYALVAPGTMPGYDDPALKTAKRIP